MSKKPDGVGRGACDLVIPALERKEKKKLKGRRAEGYLNPRRGPRAVVLIN